ncbi:MAG: TIGR01777 family oxidoreductase [Acidimicrobiales bacterium]
MRVIVTGSSGLIGGVLLSSLRDEGHEAVPLVRRPPRAGEAHWDPASGAIDVTALEGCDAVVNLAGVGIAERRWSAARKEAILRSRIESTRFLCETLVGLTSRPRALVNASAIGFYGNRSDEVLTEDSAPGTGFLAEVCQAWEATTAPAEKAEVRVVHLRTAVVLARHGGVLARQLPLFRLGLGGRLGRADRWFSWISLRDEVRAIRHILGEGSLVGAVNCSSPAPVTNIQFTRALGRALHRPAVLVVPRSALRLALGRELADELALASQRVVPTRLAASGFTFEDPSIDGALAAILAS